MIIYYKKIWCLGFVLTDFEYIFPGSNLSLFGATLTLPGLAGLALTAGMAVDSNVIILSGSRRNKIRGTERCSG